MESIVILALSVYLVDQLYNVLTGRNANGRYDKK